MARWLLVFVALLAAAETRRVRILTYNIHHGEGTDGKLDVARIAAVIAGAQHVFWHVPRIRLGR